MREWQSGRDREREGETQRQKQKRAKQQRLQLFAKRHLQNNNSNKNSFRCALPLPSALYFSAAAASWRCFLELQQVLLTAARSAQLAALKMPLRIDWMQQQQ